jgi:hypothetical protein
MRAWLRPILDRFTVGLIPVDGDFGRRDVGSREEDPCRGVQPARRLPRPRVDQASWFPSTILFGPPL